MDLLGRLPNLRNLCIHSRLMILSLEPNDIPAGHGPASVLKSPNKIFISSHLIPAFASGRKITSIHTSDPPPNQVSRLNPLLPVNYGNLGRHFGSEVMVRTLRWQNCSRVDEILHYLVEQNPGIWHLTINPMLEYTSEETFMPYFHKLACLSEDGMGNGKMSRAQGGRVKVPGICLL